MLSQSLVPAWNTLSEGQQLELAHHAMRTAIDTVSGQIDDLAQEIEAGILPDRGGAEALRLLASLLRLAAGEESEPWPHTVGTA